MGVYPAPSEVNELVAELIETYHPELADVEATILCQMHESKNGLALHGYPAYATVRLIPAKDRAAGLPDARITIDAEEWHEMPEAKQRAVLDHELHHLEVVGQWSPGDDDNPSRFVCKTDDAGRPKMKLRKHDYNFGGFYEIAERHRGHSVESEHFAAMREAYRQRKFLWTSDTIPGDEYDPAEVEAIVR